MADPPAPTRACPGPVSVTRVDWTDLPLARATVDRAAARRAEPDLVDRLRADPRTRVVLVQRGLVATVEDADGPRLDLVDASLADDLDAGPDGWLFLGSDDDRDYLALVLPDPDAEPGPGRDADRDAATPASPADLEVAVDAAPPDRTAVRRAELVAGRRWSHLRQMGSALPARDAGLGVTAVALAAWHRSHRSCPRCGSATVVGQAGWVRTCPVDGRDQYPRTDPAVIMAVVDDGDRLLLGHAAQWPEHRFSTLAGYVEPGESLEAAVRREVGEEVGIGIGEVSYRGSQPWPFPASLMLAFRAEATSTAITVDGVEVTEARWFTRDELVAAVASGDVLLPSTASIARALIEEWAGAPLPGA